MHLQWNSDLDGDKQAEAIFKSISDENDQLEADKSEHSDALTAIQRIDPGALTPENVSQATALKLRKFKLLQREIAVRQRLALELYPLYGRAHARAVHKRYSTAMNALEAAQKKLQAELLQLGFLESQFETAVLGSALRMHPRIVQLREEVEEADKAQHVRFNNSFIEANDVEIGRLQSLLSSEHAKIVA